MGKIIAIANQKGGVGKTTSAVNISAGLIKRGKSVLLVDLDPQGSLTTCLGLEPSEIDLTIADLIKDVIMRTPITALDDHIFILKRGTINRIIPANNELSAIDDLLVTATAREYMLKKILNQLKDQYDFIIIDCPPNPGRLNINALTSCDYVVVPIKSQFLDYKGFQQLYQNICIVKEETNPQIKILGVFLTMYNKQLNMSQRIESALKQIQSNLGIKVFMTKISQSTKAAEASLHGVSIFDYCANCKTAEEYESLVDELMEAIEYEK